MTRFIMGILLTILGFIVGMVFANSPYGFPGTFGPPADQEQRVLDVKPGELDASDIWLKDVNVYLVPFAGIRGNRCYSALVFAPNLNLHLDGDQKSLRIYMEGKGNPFVGVQPVEINLDDFTEMRKGRIVVKLLDEGPNAGQYYGNANSLTLKSNP